MKRLLVVSLLLFYALVTHGQSPQKTGPISLHPDNGHYFMYKGDVLALVTSAEHYGAVLNADFDYETYLRTLAEDGMNYTRIFAGSYFEIPGTSFGIAQNTLAPQPESVLTPWKRTREGEDFTYHLNEWNDPYFVRLADFMELAQQLDIIVEVTLFSSIYTDEHWEVNPQNPRNSPDIDAPQDRRLVHTLENGKLLTYQEAYVKKLAGELNGFDNFFFEIQNEPWSDRTNSVYNIVNKEELKENDWTNKADFGDELAMVWQEHMAQVIVDAEMELTQKHLIAQNYTNYKAPIPAVSDNISIINFHYAWPEAVRWNYHYDKVIGFDESGFAGSGDKVYRRQAWRFMLSGGGLFNNLDYSFATGHENGDLQNDAPGGGSKTLRQQLHYLRQFLDQLPLEKMHPAQETVKGAPGMIPYVLADESRSVVAAFVQFVGTKKGHLSLYLDSGDYEVLLMDPITGEETTFQVQGHVDYLLVPILAESGEMALILRKK